MEQGYCNYTISTYMSESLWLRHTASITLRSRSSDCWEDIIRSTFRIGYRIILQSLWEKQKWREGLNYWKLFKFIKYKNDNSLISGYQWFWIYLSITFGSVVCLTTSTRYLMALKGAKQKAKKKIMLHKVRYLIQELPHNAHTPIRPLLKWY